MAQSVDTKIVELKFNNDNFKDKVESTLKQLDKLNEDIRQVGLNEGLKNITKSAKNVDVSGITEGVEKASKGFSKLEVMGITAIANLTNSVVNFGKKMVSNLVDPIVKGGLTRAQNIKQAKFLFEGMNVFSKSGGSSYKEVMDAVTDTAYGYDEAAKAAAQLAASNVGIKKSMKTLADGSKIEAKVMTKEMTTALQGIAGVAAMTGRDFDNIAQIFTRVAGQSRVMAVDLNSMSAAGLNAAAVIGAAMGKTEAEIREMVSKGKISFSDFSNAMSEAYGAHAKDANMQFTGALSNMQAALKRIGEKVWDPLLDGARDVINSITPVINLINDKLSDGLAKTDNIIRTTSKRLSQYIDLFDMVIGVPMKGEDDWIKSHMNAWTNLADLFKMGDAYQAAEGLKAYTKSLKEFNGKEGIDGFQMIADYLSMTNEEVKAGLKDGTIGFNTFYQSFKKLWTSSKELMNIKDVSLLFDTYVQSCILAKGKTEEFTKAYNTLSAILQGGKDIFEDVKTILGSFARIFVALLGHLKPFGPIIKDIVKQFAQFTVKMADYMAKSKTLNKVIDDIVNAMARFFKALQVQNWAPAILTGIGNAFSFIAAMVEKIDEGLTKIVGAINKVFGKLIDKFTEIITDSEKLKKLLDSFKNAGIIVLAVRMINMLMKPAEMLETVSNAISDTGKSIQGFTKSIGKVIDSISGMFGKIGDVMDEVRIALQKWQKVLMAATLVEIGLAILIIAGALYALSQIDPPKLIAPLGAVVAIAGMYIKITKEFDEVKKTLKPWERETNPLGDAGLAMLEFAAALAIIAGAIYKLSEIDERALLRSFAVVEVLLITLAGIAKLLSGKETKTTGIKALWEGKVTKQGDMTKGLKGLIAMAIAVKVLAGAMKSLAGVASKEELLLAAGIIEVLMITMAGIAKWLSNNKPEKMTKGLGGLLAMALAVRLLAKPIADLAMEFAIDPAAVWQAVAVIGIFLAGMGGLAAAFSKTEDKGSALKAALSMLVMAKALDVVGEAILSLSTGNMQSVGIAMFALSAAMYAMVGALALMNKIFDEFGGGTKAILLATSLLVLSKAMSILGETAVFVGENIDAASQGLYVMAAALAGLMLAAKAMEKIKLSAIGKLALIILELIGAVAGFGIAIGILGVGLSIFGASLKSLSSGVETLYSVADGLLLLTVAMGAIALAIVAVPEVLLALGGLGVVLGIIAAAINTACNGFEKMAASMSVLVSLDGKFDSVAKTIKSFISAVKESAKDAETVGESYGKLADPLTKASDAFTQINESVSNMKKNFGDLLGVLTSSLDTIANATTTLSNLKANSLDNATTAIKNFVQGVKDLKTDASDIGDVVGAIADNMTKLRNSAIDVKNAFEAFNKTTATAIQETATNMQSVSQPIETLTNAKGAITAVKDEMINFINEIAALKDKGPEITEATDAMRQACDNVKPSLDLLNEEMKKFQWSLGDVMDHIGEGAIKIARGFSTLTTIKGKLDGTADAINSFLSQIYESTTKMTDLGKNVNSVANAVKKLGDNASKAVKKIDKDSFVESGESLAKAMSDGIKKSTAIQDAVKSSADKAKSKSNYNAFKNVGKYMVQGIIAGIDAMLPELRRKVQELVDLAKKATEAAAEIKSPSRVFMRIGAYMGEGLAIGIRNSGDRVAAESKGLAATSEDAVRSAIASISSAMDEDMNLSPIITPVVDLSDVDKSAQLVSSKFGSVSTGIATSIGGRVQNGSMANNATLNKLNKTLSSMTDTMNSRSLNNYITVDGASDPNAFADDLIRSFRLNARTV